MLATLGLGAGAALVAAWHLYPDPFLRAALKLGRRAAGLGTFHTRVDEHDVVYADGGKGEPLLMLHGFGATLDNWALVAKFLTPHFRVVAPDLPGFGDSSRLARKRYTLDDQLARIEEFARSVGLSRFHLAGNSMGGYLAAHYAARHPEQVQSLWLLAPAGVMSAQESELQQMLARGENPLLVNNPADFGRIIDMCFVKAPYTPGAFMKALAKRSMASREFHAKVFEELFSTAAPFEEALPGLATPSLITWGDQDRLLHVSGAKILQGLLPNGVLDVMPGIGHIPMVEAPEASARAFLRFAEQARSTPG